MKATRVAATKAEATRKSGEKLPHFCVVNSTDMAMDTVIADDSLLL